jgi:hypothetical protein
MGKSGVISSFYLPSLAKKGGGGGVGAMWISRADLLMFASGIHNLYGAADTDLNKSVTTLKKRGTKKKKMKTETL